MSASLPYKNPAARVADFTPQDKADGPLVALLLGVAWGRLDAGKQPKETPPVRATIVVAGVLDEDGVGELKAIRITGREKLSALEGFFPDYRRRPTNDIGAGWMAGYSVYFEFPGGETITVTVSQNENAGSWSVGRGDFKTNGDFNAFVAGLVKKK